MNPDMYNEEMLCVGNRLIDAKCFCTDIQLKEVKDSIYRLIAEQKRLEAIIKQEDCSPYSVEGRLKRENSL